MGRHPPSLFVARRHEWGVSLRCRNNPEFWLDVDMVALRARGHAADPAQGQPFPGGEFEVRALPHSYWASHTCLDWFSVEFGLQDYVNVKDVKIPRHVAAVHGRILEQCYV